jgi:TatD DNase family protein
VNQPDPTPPSPSAPPPRTAEATRSSGQVQANEANILAQAQASLAGSGLPPLPDGLPAPVIDSHTHLDAVLEHSGLDPEEALALAAAVGVDRLVQVGCDEADSVWAAAFAARHPQVVAAVALHPNEVARHPERVAAGLAQIERLAQAGPWVRAIGETGLDYFRTRDPAAQARQRDAFAAHIALAAAFDLTLVIHDRDAHGDILDLLAAGPVPSRVVMHCFSGDADLARRCVARGYWLSFPGPLTYKANADLRQALAVAPPELILVETDAPYLTPVPARGRPNSTYLMPHTVRFLAQRRGWDLDWACHRLTANTLAAFGGDWGGVGATPTRPGSETIPSTPTTCRDRTEPVPRTAPARPDAPPTQAGLGPIPPEPTDD